MAVDFDLDTLGRGRQLEALRIACDDALAIWNRYVDASGGTVSYEKEYGDDPQVLDATVIERALQSVSSVLAGRFLEDYKVIKPALDALVEAVRRYDLLVPEAVRSAIDAVHELFLGTSAMFMHEARFNAGYIVSSLAEATVGVERSAAWREDWACRVLDAWASRAELIADPLPLSDKAFEAVAAGNVAGALELIGDSDTRLRAVLLAIRGLREQAASCAARAVGADLEQPSIRRWLLEHVEVLCPEALVVYAEDDERRYAAIHDNQLVARRIDGGELRGPHGGATQLPGIGRRVSHGDGRVWVAGDLVDRYGIAGSFLSGALSPFPDREECEVYGPRAVIALDRRFGIGRGADHGLYFSRYVRLPLDKISEAALEGERLVTHDGDRVTIWIHTVEERSSPFMIPWDPEVIFTGGGKEIRWVERATFSGPAAPARMFAAGGQVLVCWTNGTATLHPLDG